MDTPLGTQILWLLAQVVRGSFPDVPEVRLGQLAAM